MEVSTTSILEDVIICIICLTLSDESVSTRRSESSIDQYYLYINFVDSIPEAPCIDFSEGVEGLSRSSK